MLRKSIFPALIILLSAAGVLFSYILAEEFHFLNLPQFKGAEPPGFFTRISAQVCGGEDSYLSCANVSRSPYARLWGYPVAVYGICFYLMVLLSGLLFWVSHRSLRPVIGVFVFWAAVIGVIADIGLLIISMVFIKALCPFCLLSYIATFLLFTSSLVWLIKQRVNPFRIVSLFKTIETRKPKLTLALYGALFTALIVASAGVSHGANEYLASTRVAYIKANKDKEIRSIVARFREQSPEDIHPDALYVYGDPQAPVTIVEFSDFRCPYCAYVSDIMDRLVKKNPGKIKVLFMNYPLDTACNPSMQRQMHPGACQLAIGAICAARQNRLAQYQKAAFGARKKQLTRQDLVDAMEQSGVDPAAFYQCAAAPDTRQTLERQIEQGRRYGINATPTLFINQKRYKGRLYEEALQTIIDLEYQANTKG